MTGIYKSQPAGTPNATSKPPLPHCPIVTPDKRERTNGEGVTDYLMKGNSSPSISSPPIFFPPSLSLALSRSRSLARSFARSKVKGSNKRMILGHAFFISLVCRCNADEWKAINVFFLYFPSPLYLSLMLTEPRSVKRGRCSPLSILVVCIFFRPALP